MIEVKLYKSPWKALLLLISSGAFVALFIFLMSIKGPKLMAILGLVFFGFGVCVALFHLFDRRPQIIINDIGIFDRTIHDQFINWELIRNAYTFDVHGQKFISLKIDDNFKPSKKKGKWYKRVAKLNEALGAQELNINLSQIHMNTKRLTAFILKMTEATDLGARASVIKELKGKALLLEPEQ